MALEWLAPAVNGALGVTGLVMNNMYNNRQRNMFDESMAFQKWQYEDSKKYNSASEQVKRLRAAGINPSLAFGQNAGTAQGMSAPSPATQNPIDLNGLSSFADGIAMSAAQLRNLKANTERTETQTDIDKVDLAYREQEKLSSLYNRDADSWFKDMTSKNIKLNNEYLARTLEDRIKQQQYETQSEQAHAFSQFYVLPYVPLKAQAEIDNLAANTKLALDSGVATLQQAHSAIMNAKTTRDAFKAQYGDNPNMWKQFSKATYKFLTQRIDTSTSEEYRNVNGISGVFGTGLKMTYDGFYNDWKKKKK